MKKTKALNINWYSGSSISSTTTIEAFSEIKNILYSAHNNMITLIYEYDDSITDRNKIVELKIVNNNYFDEDSTIYKYWGTSIENKANMSVNANNTYGSNTNIDLNLVNMEIYSHIFYNVILPLSERRDSKIDEIIKK